MRRLKDSFFLFHLEGSLEEYLSSTGQLDDNQVKARIKAWRARRPSAIEDVERLLASVGVTFDEVCGQAFSDCIGEIEHFDRLATFAEGRRNAALHEFERHRASFAQRIRENIHQIENAEFQEIESGPIAPMTAALKGPQ
jgi:hypothetical protein